MKSLNPDYIRKRFYDLQVKANSMVSTRYGANDDYVHHESFHEWATSVLDLIGFLFGENDVHYKNFYDLYKKFEQDKGRSRSFECCRGIFKAVIEEFENDCDSLWEKSSKKKGKLKTLIISPSQKRNTHYFFLFGLFVSLGVIISVVSCSALESMLCTIIIGFSLLSIFCSVLAMFHLYMKTKMTVYHISPWRLNIKECQNNFRIVGRSAEWRKLNEMYVSRSVLERVYGLGTILLVFYEKGGRNLVSLKNIRHVHETYVYIYQVSQENKKKEVNVHENAYQLV